MTRQSGGEFGLSTHRVDMGTGYFKLDDDGIWRWYEAETGYPGVERTGSDHRGERRERRVKFSRHIGSRKRNRPQRGGVREIETIALYGGAL